MDKGKYVDFNQEEPNWIWTFVKDKEGSFVFKHIRLKNLVSGDSDSAYTKIPFKSTNGLDDYVRIADQATEAINSAYPEFVKHAFNCPTERSHEIESNREIVSDALIIFSKKRYVARVKDKEGKRVDEKKIMGVELKKSDTSEAAKQILTDLVDWILDGVPSDEIRQRIKKIRTSFANRSLQEIARPISVKGLRKYEEELRTTGSMKGFPYQVRAAMYYNSLCSPSDEKITPTDKIGVLNIKHSEYKNIAFPIDIDELPAFMHNVVYDYDLMYQKTFTKIENYLSALGWDIKGIKDQKKKELFGF